MLCHLCYLCHQAETTVAFLFFQTKWIKLVHHVCGEHEWVGGKCDHDVIDNSKHELPFFNEKEKDYEALQKVILDPKLLASLEYYTEFRQTGDMESANNLSLTYASKRIAFRYTIMFGLKFICVLT